MTNIDREIVITRVFDAPRELAWQAMTDPEHVVHWWGPHGFTTTIQEMDVRPGGVWIHVMHGPDGTDYPNHSVFQEVVYPERIVFAHGGRKPGGPEADFIATWTFEAIGDKTQVTIRMVFPTAVARDIVVKEYGAIEGGKQTLERLAGPSSNDGFRGSAYHHRAHRRCSARAGVPVLDRSEAHGTLVGAARLHQSGLRA